MSKQKISVKKGRTIALKSKPKQLSTKAGIKVSVKNMDARDRLIFSNRQSIDDARQVIRKNTVEKVGDLRGMLKPKKRGGGDLRIALATRKNNSSSARSRETPMLVYAENKSNLKQNSARTGSSSGSAHGIPPRMHITNDTVQPTGIPAHMRRQPAQPPPRARSPPNRTRNPPQTRSASIQYSRTPNPSNNRSPFSAVSLPPSRREPRYPVQHMRPVYRSRSRSPVNRPYNGPVGRAPSPSRYSLPRRRSPSPPPGWRPHVQNPPNYSRSTAASYGRPEPFMTAHGGAAMPTSRMRMDQVAAERNMTSQPQRVMPENGNSANRGSRAPGVRNGFILKVSSLSTDVTLDDVEELFGDVGPIVYAKLHSPGNAEVCFHSQNDALAAIDKYDRRELDGIPMDIRLVTPASANRSGNERKSNLKKMVFTVTK